MSVYSLRAVESQSLPHELRPGETWQGWIESSRPLPEESVALLATIGMFREEIPDRLMGHISHDKTRPFISLTDRDVVVAPLSPPALIASKIAGFVRSQWNPANAGVFIGGIAGALIDILTLGVGLAGWFTGCSIGYHAACRLYKARNSRPRVSRST
jgi:hypothetical protein